MMALSYVNGAVEEEEAFVAPKACEAVAVAEQISRHRLEDRIRRHLLDAVA